MEINHKPIHWYMRYEYFYNFNITWKEAIAVAFATEAPIVSHKGNFLKSPFNWIIKNRGYWFYSVQVLLTPVLLIVSRCFCLQACLVHCFFSDYFTDKIMTTQQISIMSS